MVEFLPYIKFNKMNPGYFAKFVAPRVSFTCEELTAIFCQLQTITVTAKDSKESYLRGSFVDTCNIYDAIKMNSSNQVDYYARINNWSCDIIPPMPSDLKKDGIVEHYFVHVDGSFQIKRSTEITDADYLLCEMEGHSQFVFDPYSCQLNVSRNFSSS